MIAGTATIWRGSLREVDCGATVSARLIDYPPGVRVLHRPAMALAWHARRRGGR